MGWRKLHRAERAGLFREARHRALVSPTIEKELSRDGRISFAAEPSRHRLHICFHDAAVENAVTRDDHRQMGYAQDPDVLDTWFSSALWPISTMGWPANGTSPQTRRPTPPLLLPHVPALHSTRNPHPLGRPHGHLRPLLQRRRPLQRRLHPRHHPGRRRPPHEKNPRQRRRSRRHRQIPRCRRPPLHPASMATETQDIRLPVQLVCPHCQERLPNNVNGPVVIGCPHCKKKLTRPVQTAVATAEAPMSLLHQRPLRHRPQLRQQNLERLALHPLHAQGRNCRHRRHASRPRRPRRSLDHVAAQCHRRRRAQIHQRLSLRRLCRGRAQFFWTDLCDWYLEIAKARIKADEATVQKVLRALPRDVAATAAPHDALHHRGTLVARRRQRHIARHAILPPHARFAQ